MGPNENYYSILLWSLSLTGTSKREKKFTSSKFVFVSLHFGRVGVHKKSSDTCWQMKACVSLENQVSLTYNQLWISPDSRNKHSEEATTEEEEEEEVRELIVNTKKST